MMKKIRAASLPFLIAVYPAIFLYSLNAEILDLPMLALPLGILLGAAGLVVAFFRLIQKDKTKAANLAFVVLFFLCLSGSIYTAIHAGLNIRQRYLLPAYALLALLIFGLVYRLKADNTRKFNTAAWAVVVLLVGYNVAACVPTEIQKISRARPVQAADASVFANIDKPLPEKRPDIYFIILDEFAGPKPMREYWHDAEMETFLAELKARGFFVAENSRSPQRSTLNEIASRLNLKNYTTPDHLVTFDAIADNLVMRTLKSYGYTTVVFDNTFTAYPTKPKITADYDLTYSGQDVNVRWVGARDFSTMVLQMTALRFLSTYVKPESTWVTNHRKVALYTLRRTANLGDIGSPKFVYSHLLLPHVPFVFDKNGRYLNLENPLDWNYYLGQHQYTRKASLELIDVILKKADPKNPPIILLQSDHGARNKQEGNSVVAQSIILENYDGSYVYDILNAMYLPGYDTSRLPDDLNPHKTFEIILNYYFNAGVSLEE